MSDRERLERLIQVTEKEIEIVLKILQNQNFLDRAPQRIIDAKEERLRKFREQLRELCEELNELNRKQTKLPYGVDTTRELISRGDIDLLWSHLDQVWNTDFDLFREEVLLLMTRVKQDDRLELVSYLEMKLDTLEGHDQLGPLTLAVRNLFGLG